MAGDHAQEFATVVEPGFEYPDIDPAFGLFVDHRAGREVVGHRPPPGPPGPLHPTPGVGDLAELVLARLSGKGGRRSNKWQRSPCLVAHVARVRLPDRYRVPHPHRHARKLPSDNRQHRDGHGSARRLVMRNHRPTLAQSLRSCCAQYVLAGQGETDTSIHAALDQFHSISRDH